MTFQVGDNSVYTNQANTYPVDVVTYASTGFVVQFTAAPTLAFIRINNTGGQGWDNTTAAKLRIYNSSGTLLGQAIFTAAQGTDWISSSISVGSLTSGATVYGGIICTGTGDLRMFNSGTTFQCQSVSTGNYTTPPATVTPGSDPGSAKPSFNWYLDATASSGTLLQRPRGMGGGMNPPSGGMNSSPAWKRHDRIFVPANFQRRETSRIIENGKALH